MTTPSLSEATTPSTHGHDVLHLLVANPEAWTRAELTTLLEERFGPNARFHTCSKEGMDTSTLLDFLLAHSKIFEADGKISADPSKICQH